MTPIPFMNMSMAVPTILKKKKKSDGEDEYKNRQMSALTKNPENFGKNKVKIKHGRTR